MTHREYALMLAAEAEDRIEEMRRSGIEPTEDNLNALAAYREGARSAGVTDDEIRAARRTVSLVANVREA